MTSFLRSMRSEDKLVPLLNAYFERAKFPDEMVLKIRTKKAKDDAYHPSSAHKKRNTSSGDEKMAGRPPITREVAEQEGWYSPNEMSGLCHCGCGQETPVAKQSVRSARRVRGEHLRFVYRHQSRASVEQAVAEGWYRPNEMGGFCHCGCGQEAPVAKMTSRVGGRLRGERQRFAIGHNEVSSQRGPAHPAWRGGRTMREGYVYFLVRDHPSCNRNGYVAEHRLVMEQMLGRYLESHETVHHKNGIRDDNRPENLELRSGQHGKGATHCPHCGESLTPSLEVADA